MHLTPITLFIRGDKQFAEKKKAPMLDDSPDTSKLLSSIGKRRDFRKYRRVSAAKSTRGGGEGPRQRIHKLAFRKFH